MEDEEIIEDTNYTSCPRCGLRMNDEICPNCGMATATPKKEDDDEENYERRRERR